VVAIRDPELDTAAEAMTADLLALAEIHGELPDDELPGQPRATS
jgi:hypothetical protein